MADIDFDDFDVGEEDASPKGLRRNGFVTRIANLGGAVMSVALIAGLGLWGYKLTMRDVSGVPVVQAIKGPARIAPENPGGNLAEHQGLAVNTVTAVGEAEDPADRLTLAPRPTDLDDEDLPMAELQGTAPESDASAAASEPETATLQPASLPEAETVDPIALALAEALGVDTVPAEAATIPEPLPEDSDTAELEVTPSAPGPEAIPASVPGVSTSLRPLVRPNVDFAALSVARDARADETATAVVEIDATTLAEGTRLVQIGAYDDTETAKAEWAKVEARFGALMEGKGRVIQPAESGGRTFYRLRVQGFEDVADSRRFCAALLAEGTPCIPAQVR